jgi:predicted nucleic acid-binding protein
MTIVVPNRFTVDSNVLIYLFSDEATKADKREARVCGRKSKPVINTLVMSRKMSFSWSEIERVLDDVEVLCDVVPLTLDVHRKRTESLPTTDLGSMTRASSCSRYSTHVKCSIARHASWSDCLRPFDSG